MTLRYPPPDNEQDFEQLCLRLFRRRWDSEDIKEFARRGQKQHGIDLLGTDGKGRLGGIQCKHRELHGALSEDEFRSEIELAKQFKPKLERYAVATSAKRAKELQVLAVQITQEHRKQKLFSVEVVFWDDLNEWLNEFPDVLATVYASEPGLIAVSQSFPSKPLVDVTPTGSVDPAEPSDIHAEIDEAGRYLTGSQPQIAVVLLNRIEKRQRSRMTPRCEFRVHANLGHSHLALDDPKSAAGEYLLAKQAQPNDPEARRLAAHAHMLKGDASTCHRLLSDLIAERPEDTKARTLWVHSLPPEASFEDTLNAIPAHQQTDQEISYALSILAANNELWDKAEHFARLAAEPDPAWSIAKSHLAVILLQMAQPSEGGPTDSQKEKAREAIRFLDDAIASLNDNAPASLVDPLWSNLAIAHLIIGSVDSADRYITKVGEYATTNANLGLACAQVHYMRRRIDSAINVLRSIKGEPRAFDVDLMLAQMLGERRRDGDHEEARTLLSDRQNDVGSQREDVVGEWVETLVKLNLSLSDSNAASKVLEGERVSGLEECRQALLWAQLFEADGRRDEAVTKATYAFKALSSSTSRSTIRGLARLLENLDEYRSALECWTKLVDPSRPDEDLRHLIHCAQKSERWDVITDVCLKVRASGVIDSEFIDAEIGAMERLSPTRTLDLLTDLSAVNLDVVLKRELLVHSELLQIRLHKSKKTSIELDDAPRVDDLPDARFGRVTVDALRFGPRPEDALRYAYDLYRRFPDDLDAWAAVAASVNIDMPQSVPFPECTVVGPGIAVQYKEEDSGATPWWIIEDGPAPKISRNERDPSDPVAKSMQGKRVGDTFELRSEPMPVRTGTITAIQSKYEYRWRYCFQQIEDRFASESPIKMFSVPHKENGEIDAEVFVEQVKGVYAGEEGALETYRNNIAASVHLLSNAYSKTPFEMIQILADDSNTTIRCNTGEAHVRSKTLSVLNSAGRLILEDTAIGTLYLLEARGALSAANVLRAIPCAVVVSEFTINAIRTAIEDRWGKDGDKKFFGVQGDRLQLAEYSAEEAKSIYAKFNDFVDSLEANCHVESRSHFKISDNSSRELYSEVFGDGGLHAIELASNAESAIWTDDFTCGSIAANEHSCNRVWSQVILMWLADLGLIDSADETRSGAWLLASGFEFTSFGSRHVLAAGKIAEWDVDKEPLVSTIQGFGNPITNIGDVIRSSAETLRLVWQAGILDELSQAFTFRLLDCLDTRSGGRDIIRGIRANIHIIFGLDVITSRRFKQVIDAWIATNRGIELP